MGKLKLRPFRRKRKLNRTAGGAVLNVIIIAIFGIFMVLPLVYAIMQAFKPLDEIFIFPQGSLLETLPWTTLQTYLS